MGPGLGDGRRVDEDVERELRNARHAYERVRTEALRYRDERDRAQERIGALTKRQRSLSEQVKALDLRRHWLRKRVDLLEGQVAELEASRGVRAEAKLRAARRRLARSGRKQESTSPLADIGAADAVPPSEKSTVRVAATIPYKAWLDRGDPAVVAQRGEAADAGRARLVEAEARGDRLRVAAIVDDFTRLSLEPECELVNLTFAGWEQELEALRPDLLFVESAWRGNGASWRDKISPPSPELTAVFAWCREHGIATAFWNKEDPVHFERYVRVAAEADFVFTSELDKIAEYRLRLGHDRVTLLPFAAQPREHHPIEVRERREALAFAGAYYPEYVDRMNDLAALIAGAAAVMPVEIYDRNYGSTVESAQFPSEYTPYIVGTLGPDEIDIAYKGYVYGLNLNSVKTSRSMFARRVFELLASNTVTVSNRSAAVGVLFGDLVPMSDSAEGMRKILSGMAADHERTDRIRTLGVRKVLSEHTYRHRFAYVVATIAGRSFEAPRPALTVVVEGDDLSSVRRRTSGQVEIDASVVVVTADAEVEQWGRAEGHTVVARDRLADLTLAELADPATVGIAVLHPDDWYGEHYLRDLADAWSYSDADVVGKDQRYRAISTAEGSFDVVEQPGLAHRPAAGLTLRRSVVAVGSAGVIPALAVVSDEELPASLAQLALHRFDHVEDGARDIEASRAVASSELDIDQGAGLDQIWTEAAAVRVDWSLGDSLIVLPPELAPVVDDASIDDVRIAAGKDVLTIQSDLEPGAEGMVVARARLDVPAIWPDRVVCLGFACDGDLDVQIALDLLDEAGEVLETRIVGPETVDRGVVPEATRWAAVRWQVRGPGRSRLSPLHVAEWPFGVLGGRDLPA